MRALEIARKCIRAASHTMTLEDQALDEKALREQIEMLPRGLSDQSGSGLWEEK